MSNPVYGKKTTASRTGGDFSAGAVVLVVEFWEPFQGDCLIVCLILRIRSIAILVGSLSINSEDISAFYRPSLEHLSGEFEDLSVADLIRSHTN